MYIFEYLVAFYFFVLIYKILLRRLHATMRALNLPAALRDRVERILTLFVSPISMNLNILFCWIVLNFMCPALF